MAVRVVDPLEVVHVEHHGRQRPLLPPGERDLPAGQLEELAPVEHAGQLVDRGELFDPAEQQRVVVGDHRLSGQYGRDLGLRGAELGLAARRQDQRAEAFLPGGERDREPPGRVRQQPDERTWQVAGGPADGFARVGKGGRVGRDAGLDAGREVQSGHGRTLGAQQVRRVHR